MIDGAHREDSTSVQTAAKCPFGHGAESGSTDTAATTPLSPQQQYILTMYQQTGRLLYTAALIDQAMAHGPVSDPNLLALKDTLHWLRSFIMRPHPALGRSGAVCPYVKMAIDESVLYFSAGKLFQPESQDELLQELKLYAGIFAHMEPKTGPAAMLRCIIIPMPNASETALTTPQFTKMLKTELLKDDIMVGQFFPKSNTHKALKDKFFPVQSPFPIYVLRAFIETDWMFLSEEAEWRDIYHKRYGQPKLTRFNLKDYLNTELPSQSGDLPPA